MPNIIKGPKLSLSKFEKRINKTNNHNYIGNKTSTRIKVSSTLDHYRVCVSHVR